MRGPQERTVFLHRRESCAKVVLRKQVAKQEYRVLQLHRIMKNARLQMVYPVE